MFLIVLCYAIDIVAFKTQKIGHIFLHYGDMVTIVSIQAITGGYPDESALVLEHLRGEVARELIVCIKQFTTLCPCLDGEETSHQRDD